MRTPRYLPGVRNGVVAKRQGRSKNPSPSKKFGAGASRRQNSRRFSTRAGDRRRSEGRGARVMWLMILTGMALATGFVFALRSQFNAYRIAQAEEQLKMKLDEYARRQKFLALDQQRALNTGEADRAGKWNGLAHLRLERDPAKGADPVQKVVSAQSVRSPQAEQHNRTAENRNDSRLMKQSVRSGSMAKAAKLVKGVKSGKAAKIVSVVKLNAAKRESSTNRAKANAVKNRKQNQR